MLRSRVIRRGLQAVMLVSVVAGLWYCATPVPPYGGPKDEIPPGIVAEESSPNPAINYNMEEIRITFDEWVNLSDPGNQIVVSPPMLQLPDFNLKGKTLVITIDEDEALEENTTYMINFGEAIQDITERNVLRNFAYVFSTGPYVDSLQLSAQVVNAYSGEPEEEVLVVLHDSSADSAFQTLLPSYFASTSKEGDCELNYLRADTFYAFALKDLNANFIYDQPGELVGFLDESIVLDTANEPIQLTLFEDEPELFVLDDIESVGVMRIALSKPVETISVSPSLPVDTFRWHMELDTVYIWHTARDSIEIFLSGAEGPVDTLPLRPYTARTGKLRLNQTMRRLLPRELFNVVARQPLIDFDTSRIEMFENDTVLLATPGVALDSIGTSVDFSSNWRPGNSYRIFVYPGAFTNLFGEQNDSLEFRFNVPAAEDLLNIEITVNNLGGDFNYLIELMERDKVIREDYVTRGVDSTNLNFGSMPQGNYGVRITQDINGNGRWDTGSIKLRRQPERIFTHMMEPTRPGWDVNVQISWPEQ